MSNEVGESELFNSIISDVLEDRVEQEVVGQPVNIDELAEQHAKRTGKYREPNYIVCTVCKQEYLNLKYLKYLLTNTIYPVEEQTALVLMGYQNKDFMECCRETTMAVVEPVVMRNQYIDLASLVIHYCLARGLPLTDELLSRLDVADPTVYIDSYRSPSIDMNTAEQLDTWIRSTDGIADLQVHIVYNDANDLQIDRYCRYLAACTSCGTANTYAYLYWMLTRLNVEPEEIFLDYRVYRPCCRATYMSPIMKPIEYQHERMAQNFTGIKKTTRTRDRTEVIDLPLVVRPTVRETARETARETTTAPKKAPITAPKKAPVSIKKAPSLVPKKAPATLKKAPAKLPSRLSGR